MDRQNGGRLAVSVYPTFTSMPTEVLKVENGTQVDDPKKVKGKRLLHSDEITMKRRVMCFFSEFLATFTLLFLGCMGCVAGIGGGPVPVLHICFTFGLAVLISVQCYGHLSGSHLNPMVTVASVIMGYTPLALAPIYVIAQFLGAIGGFATLMLVTPSQHLGNEMKNTTNGLIKMPGICSPVVNPELSLFQGVLVEFIISSMLVLVCCAVWDRMNKDRHDSVSIRFGLSIAGLAMAAAHYTGAHMNPARSFAPALLNGDWDGHWVYWVGPFAAGCIPTVFYKYLFNTPPPEEDTIEGIPLN